MLQSITFVELKKRGSLLSIGGCFMFSNLAP